MLKQRIFVLSSLVISFTFLSVPSNAQTGLVDPRTTEYICVLSRTVNFTADQNVGTLGTIKANGTVVVLPCEAASVRQDRLIDADYVVLERMQLLRTLFSILKTRPNSGTESRSTQTDFQKLAREVCSRHAKIALLPLDWKSGSTGEGGVTLKTCSTLF
jgi:hypothetical protein